MIYDLLIVGAGPAGMMAAFAAKKFSDENKIALVERLDRVGGKLRYTAGGRANIAHVGDVSQLIACFHKEQKFLYPAFNSFRADDLIDFLADLGVECYVNSEGRVYPKDMNGKELEARLYNHLEDLGVEIFLSELVRGLEFRSFDELDKSDELNQSAITSQGLWHLRAENLLNNQSLSFEARSVIIATGCPASKKIAASKNECYFAIRDLDLTFVPLNAALAPIYSETIAKADLSGISIENVTLSLCRGKKILAKQDGSILLTHKGLSGPVTLNISRDLTPEICETSTLKLDMLPSLDLTTYDFNNLSPKDEQFLMSELNSKLARRLRNFLFDDSMTLFDKLQKAKSFLISDAKTVDFDMGMQCRGGLATKELNPRTMETKRFKNLYFIGDQLDLDGPEGGYNLLMAFASGYLAGKSVAEKFVL